jgi:anaerobic ribonucleoside-triphosphate reductase activating protein
MILDETFMPRGPRAAPATDPDTLVVGAIENCSHVAGPGVRSVIWVSGCHRRCPGCMKPDLFPFDVGQRVSVTELYERLAALDGIDGVTFSGGEPFEQPVALARLAKLLRSVGRDVVVYTGYRHEDLVRSGDDGIRRLLDETDILIDGEFRADLPNPGYWRGSANQRLVPLSLVGREIATSATAQPAFEEIQVSFDGSNARLTGCPSSGFFERWVAEMGQRGLLVVPRVGDGLK